jgi:outer membrane protein TolC
MLSVLVVLVAAAAPPERVPFGEAIRRALARNPGIQASMLEVSRVHGIMREVRSNAFPNLTGNGVYTRLDADRRTQGGTVIAVPRDTANANLTLTVPLIAPLRWVQWSHAAEQVDVARLSAADVRRQIAVTTARAYVAVLSEHRLAEANQRALDNAREHLEDARARLQAGTGSRLDEVRAGQEVSTSQSLLETALTLLVRSQEALGILTGGEGPLDSTDELLLPPVPPASDQAMRDAEQLRTDVVLSRKQLEYSEHVVRDTYADFLPLLVGIGQPFAATAATLTTPTTGWQAQLVLTLPIYDGGFRYGALEERRALRDEARSNLEAVLRQARSDVRAAFESVERADAALQAARDAARLAGEALDITMIAYHAGATNDLEVVDAQRRARDAENATAIAEDAARQARIDLLSATGRFP